MMPTNALAPYASKKRGRRIMKSGAERVCMIFLKLQGSSIPILAECMTALMKTVAPASRTSNGEYASLDPEYRMPKGTVPQKEGISAALFGGPRRGWMSAARDTKERDRRADIGRSSRLILLWELSESRSSGDGESDMRVKGTDCAAPAAWG